MIIKRQQKFNKTRKREKEQSISVVFVKKEQMQRKPEEEEKKNEKMFDANDWIWQIDVLYLVSSDNSLTVWTFTSYFLMLICLDSFQLMLSIEWKKVWKKCFHQKPSSYITHIYTVTVRHHVRFFFFVLS